MGFNILDFPLRVAFADCTMNNICIQATRVIWWEALYVASERGKECTWVGLMYRLQKLHNTNDLLRKNEETLMYCG